MSSPNPPTLITLLSTLFLTASCSGAEPPGRESGGGGGITSPPGANDGGDDPTPTGGETEGASDGSDSSPSGGGSDPSGGSDTWFPDVGQFPDVSQSDCEGDEPGGLEFTYIWIANSTQGTVSKIDTGTGVEVGRYATGANSDNPSRTSVNQYGAVAVGNRDGGGGITKIAAEERDCIDSNGVPGIQTSTGANDVLPFGTDECVLWHTPMLVVDRGPRGIAWEGGAFDPLTCENTVPNPNLWVAYGGAIQNVFRLDGETGVVIDQTTIPGGDGLVYGGAVNADGDFWFVNRGLNLLYKVKKADLSHEAYPIPNTPYGMGVDQNGDPWVATYNHGPLLDHVYRFDVATSAFQDAGGLLGHYRGLNLDRNGSVWVAGNDPCRLAQFDVATTSMLNDSISLPGCETPVGVSIDVEGFVWVVDQNGKAYKLDPVSHAVVLTADGLTGPYTYSDMTGAGLNLVVNPPG